jgi:hypothetical protein
MAAGITGMASALGTYLDDDEKEALIFVMSLLWNLKKQRLGACFHFFDIANAFPSMRSIGLW